jgi:hypothetical protein
MAEPIITLQEFINGITDANRLVTVESYIKPKSIKNFAKELINFLGVKESKYEGSFGFGGMTEGIDSSDLQEALKSIPENLRNSNTISIVNWDLFLQSAQNSGIKIKDNVKEYLPQAYLIKSKEMTDRDAAAYVEAGNGSPDDLEATKNAHNAIWSKEPFNSNIFAMAESTDMNNTDNPFGAYLNTVTQKIIDYERNPQTVDSSTATTMPSSTETTMPSGTTIPGSSQPPNTYISSTGNTGVSGNVFVPGAQGGIENATETAGLTLQEWLWRNPESGYLEAMKNAGFKTVPGGTSFGSRYGYSTGTKGEWSMQDFVDFPIKLKSANDLVKLQDDLRKAGYFAFTGGTLPQKGVADDITRAAWGYFLKSAALAGKEPAEFLVEKIQGVAELQWDQQIIGRDPATIQSRANELGGAILGRSLNANEITTLEGVINGWKTDELKQGNYADQPMEFDLNARMEQYLQDTYQDEAGWTNYANSRASLQRFWG